jgi:hypothetical protein
MAKRPIAVWITQVLLAIVLVAFVGLTIYVCRQILAAGMRPGIPRSAIVLYGVRALTWNCLYLFLFGLAFLGLCKARRYGPMAGFGFRFAVLGNQPLHLDSPGEGTDSNILNRLL